MKTTFNTITVIFLTFSTFCAWGQDTTKTEKIKEYYLTLTDISPINVSIKYKRHLKNRTFFKIGLVNISVDSRNYYPNFPTSFPTHRLFFSSGLEFGLEFRKMITDKFTFYHGPNMSFTYQTSISKIDNPALPNSQRKNITQTYNGGIPYTFGLLFNLNDHFFLSAELNPVLLFSYRTAKRGQNPEYDYKIISTNFSHYIGKNVREIATYGTWNLHKSYLPY